LYFFEELEKIGTNNLPGAIGTIKLPERQIIGSSYTICDLNQLLAAIGTNYLPQVQTKPSNLASPLVCDSCFGTIKLPKVQIGT
jgi:hypothetical protein